MFKPAFKSTTLVLTLLLCLVTASGCASLQEGQTRADQVADQILKNQALIKMASMATTQVVLVSIKDYEDRQEIQRLLNDSAVAVIAILNEDGANLDQVRNLIQKQIVKADNKYAPTVAMVFEGLSDLIEESINNHFAQYESDVRLQAARALIRSVAEGVAIASANYSDDKVVDYQSFLMSDKMREDLVLLHLRVLASARLQS